MSTLQKNMGEMIIVCKSFSTVKRNDLALLSKVGLKHIKMGGKSIHRIASLY